MLSKRKFKDTGYLTWKNPSALSSNSSVVVDLDDRFEPYNDCLLINLNSDNDVEVSVNQHSVQVLPKGSRLQLNQEIIKHLTLTNIGTGSISANELRVFYRNDGFEGRALISKSKSVLDLVQTGALLLRW